MRYFLLLLGVTMSLQAYGDDRFHPHQFRSGEVLEYQFEDTDTIFLPRTVDGTTQAGDTYRIQEIHIPVKVEAKVVSGQLLRNLTVVNATFREGLPPQSLGAKSFEPIGNFSKLIPKSVSFSYPNNRAALDNLESTFRKLYGVQPDKDPAKKFAEQIQSDVGGGFLFFKVQDVLQMQESVETIKDGAEPGQVFFTERHNRDGLGGIFIVAPSQMIYENVVVLNGVRCAYFKSISLGHEYIQKVRKTFTNFFFTAHVALEGPNKGLLVLGEGQETATVFTNEEKPQVQAYVQRQFSIRLK